MVARTSRRLPGISFEVRTPPLPETLPRMDVAVFVGFAASGPLNLPVLVQDAAQFTALFGGDLPLAWDTASGEQVFAYLAPTVEAYFANGGKRAWIVRVASGSASTAQLPIPGLARLDGSTVTPAFATARSPGSWADTLEVAAALLSRTFPVDAASASALQPILALSAPDELLPGDLLRIQFADAPQTLFGSVRDVTLLSSSGSSLHRPLQAQVTIGARAWFSPLTAASVPGIVQALAYLPDGSTRLLSVLSAALTAVPGQAEGLSVALAVAIGDAPLPGTLLRLDAGAEQVWMQVQAAYRGDDSGSPPSPTTDVSGPALCLSQEPSPLPAPTGSVERLAFELWTRQGGSPPVRSGELTFDARHPAFWSALPGDETLFGERERDIENPYRELWTRAAQPRFPLAGVPGDTALYIPLFMPYLPESFLGPAVLNGTALERDGLEAFSSRLFLDENLGDTRAVSLMAQADYLRYESANPRRLTGVHAALEIEEATLVVVPDAIHRGWLTMTPPAPAPPEPPAAPGSPRYDQFDVCGPRSLAAPTLQLEQSAEQADTYTLLWFCDGSPGATYRLEEATRPDYSDAIPLYAGPFDRLTVYGRGRGDYYYRVRVSDGRLASPWSEGVVVRVGAGSRYELEAISSYRNRAPDLLALHQGLLRMCAARGDLFVVLTLPEHYREDEALAHARTLEVLAGAVGGEVTPLENLEAASVTYGALYHPWLWSRSESAGDALRLLPPDGAITGLIARRALERGAWIAPANEPLRNVVALQPVLDPARWWDLQDAGVNVVRQEPRGFLCLSAETLSGDPDFRPIGVRRLLQLLRRAALRLGTTYVFEPNSDAFRRMVQRGFQELLGQLYQRGAFAGRSPATSFQVIADQSVNSPQSVEQGRLIVLLKVAPSLPMTFITIRLTQTGEQGTVTEVR